MKTLKNQNYGIAKVSSRRCISDSLRKKDRHHTNASRNRIFSVYDRSETETINPSCERRIFQNSINRVFLSKTMLFLEIYQADPPQFLSLRSLDQGSVPFLGLFASDYLATQHIINLRGSVSLFIVFLLTRSPVHREYWSQRIIFGVIPLHYLERKHSFHQEKGFQYEHQISLPLVVFVRFIEVSCVFHE